MGGTRGVGAPAQPRGVPALVAAAGLRRDCGARRAGGVEGQPAFLLRKDGDSRRHQAAAIVDLVNRQPPGGQRELLLAAGPPEMAAVEEYPRLDPRQVKRAYEKLRSSNVAALVARRAGLERSGILNCHPWPKLKRLLKR